MGKPLTAAVLSDHCITNMYAIHLAQTMQALRKPLMAAVLSHQYSISIYIYIYIYIYAIHVAQTMQALRKPLMAAVLSHLHHSALSQPWGIRVAAVQAIAKVAVRSEEPYKLQGYTILKSLSAPDYISDPDATGELSGCLSVM